MNYPTEFIIYTAQIVLFQFIASPYLSLFAYKQAIGRNREWLKQNPEILDKYKEPSGYIPKFLGAIFLAILFYGVFKNDSRDPFELAHYASIGVFLIQHLGYDLIRSHFIKKEVPKPEKRSAGLVPRQISDYLPMPLFIGAVGLIGIFIIGWTYLYANGTFDFIKYLKSLFIQLSVIGVGLGSFIYCLKRKPIQADAKVAKAYRQSEVYVTFTIFLAFVVNSIIHLIANLFGMDRVLESGVIIDYVFTLMPMAAFAWFLINKNMRSLVYEDLRSLI